LKRMLESQDLEDIVPVKRRRLFSSPSHSQLMTPITSVQNSPDPRLNDFDFAFEFDE